MLINVLTRIDQVEALRNDWLVLHKKAGASPFSHPAWINHYFSCYPPDELAVCAAHDGNGALLALLPFAIRKLKIRGMSYRALQHGAFDGGDYSEFLIDPAANPRSVINRVLKALEAMQSPAWDLIHVDNVSDRDPVGKLFLALAQRRFYSARVTAIATPSIDYRVGFRDSKKVANIKRNMQHATDPPALTILNGADIGADDMMRFAQMQRCTHPEAEFHRDRAQQFYRQLLADADFAPHCELAELRREGQLIAGHFGFVDGDTYYYYVPAYDQGAAAMGPGQYLLWQLIERAEARGLRRFDLLRGAEPYKYQWANRVDRNQTLLGTRRGAPVGRRLIINLWALRRSLPMFGDPGI